MDLEEKDFANRQKDEAVNYQCHLLVHQE